MVTRPRLLLIVAAVLALLALGWWVQSLRAARDKAIIERNNAAAALGSLKVIRQTDSATYYQRLAFQSDTLAGLRKELGKERGKTATLTALLARPRPVDTVTVREAAPPDSAGQRVLADSIIGPPVDAKATVALDSALTRATWHWQVRPWAIPLTVDVGCLGHLKPDVIVKAPPWVTLDSVGTTTRVGVCGEPAKGLGWKLPAIGGGVAALTFILGLLLGR